MNLPPLHDFSLMLLINAALLLGLTQLLDLLLARRGIDWSGRPGWLTGLGLGLIGLLLMQTTAVFTPGILIDARYVLLSLSGLFLGPLPSLIATLMLASFRAWLGGDAALTGVIAIFGAWLLGLLWRRRYVSQFERLTWRSLLGLGLAVHLLMLALMLLMPWALAWQTLREISLPVLLIHPPLTLVLGLLLQERWQRQIDLTQLREREQRYHGLFDNNHAMMLIIDPDKGRILDANPAATAYYGWSLEQLRGMRITDINCLSAEQIQQEMAKARRAERQYFEFQHRRADGSVRDVEVFSGVIPLQGKDYLYSIIHDVSARKQAQAELLALQEQRHREQAEALRQQLQAQQRLELALEEAEQGNAELQRFNRAMVGRELEMIRLKQEVNQLSQELGHAEPYDLSFAESAKTEGAAPGDQPR
ncbi:PAS domain S-box protein [Magnetovirga frankeli]|uniref:LytS/YhcK type 5TM receptor domain-containing protein n=1 Tax=Magnetovirga frankeli TaxID=947516 RepID=UPI001292FD59|nr:PAS domain S-box protein [gamma proteobacterium SS-5]